MSVHSEVLSLIDEAISRLEQARAYARLSLHAEEDAAIHLASRAIHELKYARVKINEALEEEIGRPVDTGSR